jgi:hypothetical protein
VASDRKQLQAIAQSIVDAPCSFIAIDMNGTIAGSFCMLYMR